MGDRFAGRRALVTGASRGIGAGIAERLAAEGAAVAITARTLDAHPTLPGSLQLTAERLAAHGNPVAIVVADLADADDRQRVVPEAVEALGGPVDILVNNAAAAIYQGLDDYPLKRRRLMFEVNVHAPVDLAQAVLGPMREAGEGWIVNVSSGSANLAEGPPFQTGGVRLTYNLYGATKAALNRLTNGWAVELHGSGVRMNTIEPRAAVLSEGADELVGHQLTDDQIESLEAMVEATLVLCDCPADHTGRIEVSLDLLDRVGLEVRTLDGSAPYPGGQRVWKG